MTDHKWNDKSFPHECWRQRRRGPLLKSTRLDSLLEKSPGMFFEKIMRGRLLPVWDSACTRSLVLSLCRDRQWRNTRYDPTRNLFSVIQNEINWEHTSPYYYHLKAIWETHSVWFFCGEKKEKKIATLEVIMRDSHISSLRFLGSSSTLQASSLTLPVQLQVWSSHFAERYLRSSFWRNKSPATPAI